MLLSKLLIIKKYYLIFTEFCISAYETFIDHPVVIFFQNIKLPKRFFSHKNPVINYINKFISTLTEAILLVAATGILCFLIYYIFDLFWYLYITTPMGEKFISLHPERAETIFEFSNLDLRYFCAEVNLSAFVICFLIGVVCQFLHISHYLYLSQGLFGKLVYWGIPLTGAVSYYIKNEYDFSNWGTTALIVMLPTYLLFISCFKYSQKLIPEVGTIIKISTPPVKYLYHQIFVKIIDRIRYLIK